MSGILFWPRISILSGTLLGSDPNIPSSSKTAKDGSNTFRAANRFVGLTLRKSSPFTCTAVPVKLFFAFGTYPVTITSSISVASSTILTSIFTRFFITTACVFIPIKEKTNSPSKEGTKIR